MTEIEEPPVKFMKFLVKEHCTLDSMALPKKFYVAYGDCIPQYVNLVQRNGDEVMVEFQKDKGLFVGMKQLFNRYDCGEGCILAFQYNGLDNFWVHVITSSYEVYGELPDDCGCKFVKVIFSDSLEKLQMPIEFIEKFGDSIPSEVNFKLRNGKCIEGSFDPVLKQLSGLQQVFRQTRVKALEIVLFTYYDSGKFDISVFGHDCLEKPVKDNSHVLDGEHFEIVVQSSHLQKYCLGVHISSRFKLLTQKWEIVDSIKVYHASRSWRLQIKKRNTNVEIHSGWNKLKTDLNLKKEDICLFQQKSTIRRYNLQIYRKTL